MKRVTIYNEKGGVGKTTVTSLLAAWLAYGCGRRVCVLDFDYPSFHLMDLRSRERTILRDPRSPLAVWLSAHPAGEPYDLFRVVPGSGGVYTPGEVFPLLKNLFSTPYDYVLYDFPGRFTPEEPVAFMAANGFVDFLGVPMDTDTQSRRSALVVADAFQRHGIPLALFWNRVTLCESKGDGKRFERGAVPFRERGMEVMDEAVRDIRKLSRDSSEMTFVRSTLCFPDRYVNLRSPGIIPFLEALKARIDRSDPVSL